MLLVSVARGSRAASRRIGASNGTRVSAAIALGPSSAVPESAAPAIRTMGSIAARRSLHLVSSTPASARTSCVSLQFRIHGTARQHFHQHWHQHAWRSSSSSPAALFNAASTTTNSEPSNPEADGDAQYRRAVVSAAAEMALVDSSAGSTAVRRLHAMSGSSLALSMARRGLHSSPTFLEAKRDTSRNRILVELIADESKVEQQLKRLITQKLREQKNPQYSLLIDKRAVDELEKKARATVTAPWYRRMWTKQFWVDAWRATVHEFHHYKAGFQLLWTDMRLSFRYLRRVLNGQKLTRRERKQFIRTAGDIFRLVPFSAFIIVPGMELLLPFAIKFFPSMLPSQFQGTKTKLVRQRAELRVKLNMAKFLQETLEDMALSRGKDNEEDHSSLAKEFRKFLQENRKAGFVPASAILKFAPLFKDSLTLDTLDAPQLRALCKLLNVPSIGSSAMLRFQLRTRLRSLHADDLIITKEGVDSLSTTELQAACRERGMRALGMSAEGLRQRLQQWLDLHILHGVPPTLLLLSRVLFLPESVPETERIRAVLEHLPEDLTAQVQTELLEAEGEDVDAKLRLKIIAAEEERIKREELEKEKEKEKVRKGEKEPETAEEEEALAEEKKRAEAETVTDTAPAIESAEQGASAQLPEPAEPTSATTEAEAERKAPASEPSSTAAAAAQGATPTASAAASFAGASGKDDKDKLTLEDCLDLALVISQLSGQKQVAPAFQSLKEEVEEHKGDLQELAEYGEGTIRESVASLRLSTRVERLLRKVESSMSEIDLAALAELDLDRDGVISRQELTNAMKRMKNSPTPDKIQRWADILDADHDGKLQLDTLQKVLNLIAYEGVDVHPDHLQAIVDLVEKQESIASVGDDDGEEAKAIEGNGASSTNEEVVKGQAKETHSSHSSSSSSSSSSNSNSGQREEAR